MLFSKYKGGNFVLFFFDDKPFKKFQNLGEDIDPTPIGSTVNDVLFLGTEEGISLSILKELKKET